MDSVSKALFISKYQDERGKRTIESIICHIISLSYLAFF